MRAEKFIAFNGVYDPNAREIPNNLVSYNIIPEIINYRADYRLHQDLSNDPSRKSPAWQGLLDSLVRTLYQSGKIDRLLLKLTIEKKKSYHDNMDYHFLFYFAPEGKENEFARAIKNRKGY